MTENTPETSPSQSNTDIIEYFNEKYSGQRGKCLHCGIDFPLE